METTNALPQKYHQNVLKHVITAISEKNITQKELSTRSGISQPTLSKLLSGKSNFTLDQLARISYALHIDIAEFVKQIQNLLTIFILHNLYQKVIILSATLTVQHSRDILVIRIISIFIPLYLVNPA